MAKTLKGKVVSVAMKDTIIVEVVSKKPHTMYRKLLTRSKRFKVATNGLIASVGDTVKIEETKPVSKGKYFKLVGEKGKMIEKVKEEEKA